MKETDLCIQSSDCVVLKLKVTKFKMKKKTSKVNSVQAQTVIKLNT